MTPSPIIAIVGAGFSGTLLALNLLRSDVAHVQILLTERSPGFGPGLAFSSPNPDHLLNVRVGNMSAWPGDPRHLERWLAEDSEHPSADSSTFISRGTYGAYLTSMLRQAIGTPRGAERLILVQDEVVRLKQAKGRLRLVLGMGRELDADAAVLAIGNLVAAPPEALGLEDLPRGLYVQDPWSQEALAGLKRDDPVALLGSGLTMVDLVLALKGRGHTGPIFALSRRGLTPHRHEGFSPIDAAPVVPKGSLASLLRERRSRAGEVGWRRAVDELRPLTQALWRTAAPDERRRFLRHLRPWWDIHRHRAAPAVADQIDDLRAAGRLRVASGKIVRIEPAGDQAELIWRGRGGGAVQGFRAARIVNCMGPIGDLSRTTDPLLRGLFDDGLARVDPLALGVEVDPACGLVDASGQASHRLYAVGPITRGAFWECASVPDIRNQVADLAEKLANHWAVAG